MSDLPLSGLMKYFEPLDIFLRIRIYTKEQVKLALSKCRAMCKKDYLDWLIDEVLIDFERDISPKIKERFGTDSFDDVKIALYQTCLEVNPQLEIHNASIPVYDPTPTDESPRVSDDASSPSQSGGSSPRVVLEKLRRRVIGQEEAIDTFGRFWRRSCAGLRDPRRPVGSLMFIGPTGVGKTELAKAIAVAAFDGAMIRIDCSEYAEQHEYAKLIGSPPGYVGHGQGGYLTEELKENPRSVVLFDEIEKADVRIYNLLLQAIDEGRLTDSEGITVSLKEAFIILTSNIGTTEIQSRRSGVGFSKDSTRSIGQKERTVATREALEDHFPLEFLNRLDDIVVFRELGEPEVLRVAGIFIDRLRSRLSGLRHHLVVTPAARIEIARRGFDPKWGAREIGRTVGELIEDPISDLLVSENFTGSVKFKVFVKSGELGVRPEWM